MVRISHFLLLGLLQACSCFAMEGDSEQLHREFHGWEFFHGESPESGYEPSTDGESPLSAAFMPPPWAHIEEAGDDAVGSGECSARLPAGMAHIDRTGYQVVHPENYKPGSYGLLKLPLLWCNACRVAFYLVLNGKHSGSTPTCDRSKIVRALETSPRN